MVDLTTAGERFVGCECIFIGYGADSAILTAWGRTIEAHAIDTLAPLGVVHIFRLETDDVQKGEAMITELQFLDREQLRARRETMESWSQICFDRLDELLAATAAR